VFLFLSSLIHLYCRIALGVNVAAALGGVAHLETPAKLIELLRDAGEECVPRQAVNLLIARAAGVSHENRNIVARMADVVIEQQAATMLADMNAHRLREAAGRCNAAADRADVRFDDAQGQFYRPPPFVRLLQT